MSTYLAEKNNLTDLLPMLTCRMEQSLSIVDLPIFVPEPEPEPTPEPTPEPAPAILENSSS